jgi:ABC-type nitrate/sulfonate/bicarbonate transport system, permease component
MSGAIRRRRLGVVGLVGVLAVWETVAQLHLINSLLLSSPSGIVRSAAQEMQDPMLWRDLSVSAQEYLFGLALAALVGVAVGLVTGLFRRVDYLIEPWLTILNSMPTIAVAPLLIIVFGIDMPAKVVIIFLFAVFPLAVNMRMGVHATSNRYLRVARSFSASEWTSLRTVILPGALPYMVTGLRVAGGRAIVGLVAAEFMAANAGIGFRLGVASTMLRTGTALFLIIIIGLSGVGTNVLLKTMEARLERWRPVPTGR